MGLVKHNYALPFNILRCAYVHYGVTNLQATQKFYTQAIGLFETEAHGRSLYFRGLEEQDHHSYIFTESKKPEVKALGFKVAFDKELDQLALHLKSLGLEYEWVTRHAQERTLQTQSLEGIPLEFFARQTRVESNIRNFHLFKGCHPQRIDHFNCFTPNAQATYEFFVKQLGFKLTEYTLTEDGEMWAAWMQRKGNVHDMALTNGDGPRLHHSAVWSPTPMHIINMLDIMASIGYVDNIERGPGRHGVSNAFFLYVIDPDGHRIEIYSSDYLSVDPDMEPLGWNLSDPRRQTLWGAAAPRSWFEHGSVFENVALTKATMKARPIIAE